MAAVAAVGLIVASLPSAPADAQVWVGPPSPYYFGYGGSYPVSGYPSGGIYFGGHDYHRHHW